MSTLVLPKTRGRFEDAWISCKSDFWQIVSNRDFWQSVTLQTIVFRWWWIFAGEISKSFWKLELIVKYQFSRLKKKTIFWAFSWPRKDDGEGHYSNLWRGHIPISLNKVMLLNHLVHEYWMYWIMNTWTFQFGCQRVPLPGVNSQSLRVLYQHPLEGPDHCTKFRWITTPCDQLPSLALAPHLW